MVKLPDYVGALAFGIKMGVIFASMSLVEKVYSKLKSATEDGLLSDGDMSALPNRWLPGLRIILSRWRTWR